MENKEKKQEKKENTFREMLTISLFGTIFLIVVGVIVIINAKVKGEDMTWCINSCLEFGGIFMALYWVPTISVGLVEIIDKIIPERGQLVFWTGVVIILYGVLTYFAMTTDTNITLVIFWMILTLPICFGVVCGVVCFICPFLIGGAILLYEKIFPHKEEEAETAAEEEPLEPVEE